MSLRSLLHRGRLRQSLSGLLTGNLGRCGRDGGRVLRRLGACSRATARALFAVSLAFLDPYVRLRA